MAHWVFHLLVIIAYQLFESYIVILGNIFQNIECHTWFGEAIQ